MGKIGSGNPLAFVVGGLKSDPEQINESLKQFVGEKNYAEDGTIEADWRLARARGLAAGYSDERAFKQNFPDRITDYIDEYAEMLGLSFGEDVPQEDQRQAITRKWTDTGGSVTEDLENKLKEIDPRFSILEVDEDTIKTTASGRWFEEYTPGTEGPAFGADFKNTEYPNYSNRHVCYVDFNVTAASWNKEAQVAANEAAQVLNDNLPSWVSFVIGYTGGFFLDIDRLDIGAFGT